jgi:hypothetical protein
METKKNFSTILWIFSILYAIAGVIFMFIKPRTANPEATSTMLLSFLGLFVFIGIPVYAVKYYRDQGNFVSISSSVKLGVLIGLLGGLLLGIYSYIYFKYINPEIIDQILEISRKVLEDNDMFDQESIEQQMEMTKNNFASLEFAGQLFTGLLYGVIGGLLGGLFFKTPQEDEY